MKTKRLSLSLAALLLLALFVSACTEPPTTPSNGGGSPASPPTTGGGSQEFLTTGSGNATKMWVQLGGYSPSPNSKVPVPFMLQSLNLTVGLNDIPNPATTVHWIVGLSHDGNTIYRVLMQMSEHGAGSQSFDTSQLWQVQEVPEYLVIQGSYPGDTNGSYGTFPGESGAITKSTGYHQ